MQFRFAFKHTKSSESMQDYATQKINERVRKYVTKPIDAEVTFFVEGEEQNVHCHLRGGDGFSIEGQARSGDMHSAVDMLLDKLDIQLRKHKEKLKHHKRPEHLNLKLIQTDPEISKDDCDSIPVDAEDMIKYENAKIANQKKASGD